MRSGLPPKFRTHLPMLPQFHVERMVFPSRSVTRWVSSRRSRHTLGAEKLALSRRFHPHFSSWRVRIRRARVACNDWNDSRGRHCVRRLALLHQAGISPSQDLRACSGIGARRRLARGRRDEGRWQMDVTSRLPTPITKVSYSLAPGD
jgi:hypothetical protein